MTKTKINTTHYDSAEYLRNKKDIVAYLDAALEDGEPALIRHALRATVRASGIAQIAHDSPVAHKQLYRALMKHRDLKLTTVLKVVNALGLRLCTHPA